MHNETIVLTMAGASKRFADAGYRLPKYMLTAHGHSVFSWAAMSLLNFVSEDGQFICVCRKDHGISTFVREELCSLGVSSSNVEVVQLDGPTDGQATTALGARSVIRNPDRPVLIYNIDTYCDPSALRPDSVRGAGWIPCFSAPGSSWSFAESDEDGKVTRVVEKERISDDCTLGLYWFRSLDVFVSAYEDTYSRGEKGAVERYIAPIYNSLVAGGMPVYIERVDSSCVTPIGTPAEYEAFRRSSPPAFLRRGER